MFRLAQPVTHRITHFKDIASTLLWNRLYKTTSQPTGLDGIVVFLDGYDPS